MKKTSVVILIFLQLSSLSSFAQPILILGSQTGEGTCMSAGQQSRADCKGAKLGEGVCMSAGQQSRTDCKGVTLMKIFVCQPDSSLVLNVKV